MIKSLHKVSLLFAVVLIPVSLCSSAQIVDVSACRALEDRLQRFDCYEELEAADTVPAEAADIRQNVSVQPELADKPPSAARPQQREQARPESGPVVSENADATTFGRKSAEDDVRLIESKKGKTELVGTIAALEKRLPNLWVITLTSGQRWRQMQNKPYALKEGDEVRIYTTMWGSSYRMTVARLAGFIQVERID